MELSGADGYAERAALSTAEAATDEDDAVRSAGARTSLTVLYPPDAVCVSFPFWNSWVHPASSNTAAKTGENLYTVFFILFIQNASLIITPQ